MRPDSTMHVLARSRLWLASIALLVPVAIALHVTGSKAHPLRPVPKHSKVRVVKGQFSGTLGVVLEVSKKGKRRYRVKLAGGAVYRFRRGQLRRLALRVGDSVAIVSGRFKGRFGSVNRIRPRRTKAHRRIRRRFVVGLQTGKVRRFERRRLAYVPPGTGFASTFPLPRPSCEPGATVASTAGGVRSEVAAGQNVCVTGTVGDVDLSGLHPSSNVFVGTTGPGSIGEISLIEASRITVRARFRETEIRDSHFITIEHSIVGGSRGHRIYSNLVYIPCCGDDITIRDNEIAWTTADSSGNTGYGVRLTGSDEGRSDRVRIVRNYIHHIGADGIQGMGDGVDDLIDRNEIAFVAPPPGSSEHSDDFQIIDHGPNLRITDNYLHHNGYLDAGVKSKSESGPYIHAGDDDPLRFENNLIRDEGNFMQVGNLGTGGCSLSNLTFRRNTFFNNARAYNGRPDLMWRLCGGSSNLYERNLVIADFANEFGFGASHTTARHNLEGHYALDGQSNCTSVACHPPGAEPVGYSKPAGVHW